MKGGDRGIYGNIQRAIYITAILSINAKINIYRSGNISHKPLQDQLKDLLKNPAAVRELKTENGRTVEQILKNEAERLKDLIQHEIDILYSKPQGWYKRTNNFRKALDDNISVDPQSNTITFGFDRELSEHDSYITQFNPSYNNKGHVPILINDGFKPLYSNTYFDGEHYMERAISKFNQSKHHGIKVRLQKSSNRDGIYYDEYL